MSCETSLPFVAVKDRVKPEASAKWGVGKAATWVDRRSSKVSTVR
jgi:hypothetical protein